MAPLVCAVLAGALWRAPAQAQEPAAEDPHEARIYTTREERREAGLRHRVVDGLFVSGLIEAEAIRWRSSRYDEPGRSSDGDDTVTAQLGIEALPLDGVKIELISEFERDSESGSTGPILDEAVLALETGDFELELGRLYVPFGVYFSRFVSGPLVELGETRASGAVLSYGPDERLDVAAFAYRGRARPQRSDSRRWDWGLALEGSPAPFATVGLSYLSDLADADENLLEDSGRRYVRRVDAWSAYAVAGHGRFEASAEWLAALGRFRELDADRDRPRAWNLELGYAARDDLDFALRVEGSRELEDAPRLQYGLALSWRILRTASFTIEYLRGRYARGLAEDDQERTLDRQNLFGALLGIEL